MAARRRLRQRIRSPRWIFGKLVELGRLPKQSRARFAQAARRDRAMRAHLRQTRKEVRAVRGEIDAVRADFALARDEFAARSDTQALARAVNALRVAVDASTDRTQTAIAQLAVQLASTHDPEPLATTPLVSIIVPTYNRAERLPHALESIREQSYGNWECLIIDDGSDDDTAAAIGPFLQDKRFEYRMVPHGGAAAARNHGLSLARGEIIAYLDSDNAWHRSHLMRIVRALGEAPNAVWALSGQAIVDDETHVAGLRPDLGSTRHLNEENFADLNAVAHRSHVLADIGAFDTSLRRLIDWDFVLRLAQLSEPARTFSTTSLYSTSASDRISSSEPGSWASHQIRSRFPSQPARGMRVLFAEWHYPQITESYISAMVTGLQRLGAEVEVWSEFGPEVEAMEAAPKRGGLLEDALLDFRPDVVITHWLHKGSEYREITRAAGIPHVIRTHGFDYAPDAIDSLMSDPGVVVHSFPHLIPDRWASHPRLVLSLTCFDDRLYLPAPDKDLRMVFRVVAGLPTKDVETFFRTASLCPDHRFVLVIGHAYLAREQTELLIARRDELAAPVEILVDLQPKEVAALSAQAGIYLHTHGTDATFGMSMSIAEAMATGSWVLGRDLSGMADYLGSAGALYDGKTEEQRAESAASLIRGSLEWTDERWSGVQEAAVERAFARHSNTAVAAEMLKAWRKLIDLPTPANPRVTTSS